MSRRPKIEIHKGAEGYYSLQRMRSDEGRFWTKKMKLSDPAELAAAKPEEVWKTGDGRQLLVKDMETEHIINVMHLMYLREYAKRRDLEMSGYAIEDPDKNTNTHTRNTIVAFLIERRPVYKTMMDELERRNNPQPEPAPKRVGRRFDFD